MTVMCKSCFAFFVGSEQTAPACKHDDCKRVLCPTCFRNYGTCPRHRED